ncbi:hypothetical protein FIU94_09155 [Sulfitobacter sp. THAF37]|nr:hypothetical protein FIU94_09155 [Sulfitobacter sp. THAF37]
MSKMTCLHLLIGTGRMAQVDGRRGRGPLRPKEPCPRRAAPDRKRASQHRSGPHCLSALPRREVRKGNTARCVRPSRQSCAERSGHGSCVTGSPALPAGLRALTSGFARQVAHPALAPSGPERPGSPVSTARHVLLTGVGEHAGRHPRCTTVDSPRFWSDEDMSFLTCLQSRLGTGRIVIKAGNRAPAHRT